jgi:hypothetical protein
MGIGCPSLLGNGHPSAATYPFNVALEEQLPDHVVRQVCGNGMHICQVGFVFLAVLALTAKLQRQ